MGVENLCSNSRSYPAQVSVTCHIDVPHVRKQDDGRGGGGRKVSDVQLN